MNGDPLQASDAHLGARFPTHAHLLAAALFDELSFGPTPVTKALADRSIADAREAVASRSPLADEEVLAYSSVYRAAQGVKVRRPPVSVPPSGPAWERALAALPALRRRQRAAVLLFYSCSLALRDVGRVVGVGPGEAQRVVDAGVAALMRHLGSGAGIGEALRIAGQRLVGPAAPSRDRAPVARLPRAVVRTLTSPLVSGDAPAEIAASVGALAHGRSRPAEVLLTPAKAAGEPAPAVAEGRPRPRRPVAFGARRAALVALLVGIVVSVLVPGSALERRPPVRAWTEGPPTAVVLPATAVRLEASAVAAPRVVAVRRGDSLWRIAEARLGDPLRWPEIWRLNRGRRMTTGGRFTDPGLIRPGWRLRLPAL